MKEKKQETVEWWPDQAVAQPRPWEEAKPKLTQEEIEKAAKLHNTFVDSRNQMLLTHIMKNKFHKETFFAFHKLSHMNNRNPVDHPYSVDQYIVDKALCKEECPNAPCYCGACECE